MRSRCRRPKVRVSASVLVRRGGHRELQGEVVDQGADETAGRHRGTVSIRYTMCVCVCVWERDGQRLRRPHRRTLRFSLRYDSSISVRPRILPRVTFSTGTEPKFKIRRGRFVRLHR